MSSSAGGAAAINGFLYQILHQLSLIARTDTDLQITVQRKSQSATLTLEPVDGGDSSYRTDSLYLVEQYKARTTNKPWSLNEIINQVLPDLRLAANKVFDTNLKCEFNFITDGRISDIELLTALRDELKNINPNSANKNIKNLLSQKNLNLFNRIAEDSRRKNSSTDEDIESLVIMFLIKNLHIKPSITQDQLISEINAYVKKFQPNIGDEDSLRNQLIGYIMTKTKNGAFNITARKLLIENNMNPDRLIRLKNLHSEAGTSTLKRLKKFFNYEPILNVKNDHLSFDNKNILIITGESGYGKTWQLCNTIYQLIENKEIVIFEKDLIEPLNKVANTIWKTILCETTIKDIEDISIFYKNLSEKPQSNWLTIALDDVRQPELVNSLLSRDWDRLGIRLLITAPIQLVGNFSDSLVTIFYTRKFSIDELVDYLAKFNKSWLDLPFDLREILRTPILAKLYIDLPYNSFSSSPNTEYEIFDQFWRETLHKQSISINHISDEAILKELASEFTKGALYPYAHEIWSKCGLTDEKLAHLEKLGWLKILPNSEIEFTHDRLLNWTVAKDLAYKFSKNHLSESELIELISPEIPVFQLSSNKKRLGYILLDVIWILLQDNYPMSKLVILITKIEKNDNCYGIGEHLYNELLPTLGKKAKSLIYEIIMQIDTSNISQSRKARLLGEGLAKIANHEEEEIDQILYNLLNSSIEIHRLPAIEVLKHKSYPQFNNRIWYLYNNKLQDENCESLFDLSSLYKSLKAAAQHTPKWLEKEILTDDSPYIHKLAFILNEIDQIKIWHNCKNYLIKKTSLENSRGIISCIKNYYDMSLINYLTSCLLIREDHVNSSAFEALAHLDHSLAIDHIDKLSENELYLSRHNWLPILALKEERKLIDYLQKKPHQSIVYFIEEYPRITTLSIARMLMNDLDNAISEYLLCENQNKLLYIENQIKTLIKINNSEIIAYVKKHIANKTSLILFDLIKLLEKQNNFNDIRAYEHTFLKEVLDFLIIYDYEGLKRIVKFGLTQNEAYQFEKYLGYTLFIIGDSQTINTLDQILDRLSTLKIENIKDSYSKIFLLLSIVDEKYIIAQHIERSNANYSIDNFRLLNSDTTIPTKKLLGIFESLSKNERKHLLYLFSIAAVSNNKEITPFLYPYLEKIAGDDNITEAACIALFYLRDDSETALEFAERTLYFSSQKHWAINILVSAGEKSYLIIIRYIESNLKKELNYWGNNEYRILACLFKSELYKNKAIEYSLAICTKQHYYETNFLYIAAFSKEQKIKDLITARAFYEHSSRHGEVLNAIKALFIYSPSQALQAVEKALLNYDSLDGQLCKILVDNYKNEAVTILFKIALSINPDNRKLLTRIARTLRLLDPSTVEGLIFENIYATEKSKQITTIYLASWLSNEKITQEIRSFINSPKRKPLLELTNALYRIENNLVLKKMMKDFAHIENWNEKWVLLKRIINIADPFIIEHPQDSLFFKELYTDRTHIAFKYYAEKELYKRSTKKGVLNGEFF